jgi:hypothetical protein
MRSFWSEPFLWIHLAGIAVFPLALAVVWVGLAIGDPLPFFWLEILIVAIVGIIPIFWMQWNRPFDIFSLLIIALKPERMSLGQRQLLSLFQGQKQRVLTAITAGVMLAILWELYSFAPLAAMVATSFPQVRILGLLMAALAFLVAHLFIQVPVSVLGVLLTSEEKFATTEPYPLEKIPQNFTLPGFKVNQILPNLES